MTAIITDVYKFSGIGVIINIKTISPITIENGDYLLTSRGYPFQIKELQCDDGQGYRSKLVHPGFETFSLRNACTYDLYPDDTLVKIDRNEYLVKSTAFLATKSSKTVTNTVSKIPDDERKNKSTPIIDSEDVLRDAMILKNIHAYVVKWLPQHKDISLKCSSLKVIGVIIGLIVDRKIAFEDIDTSKAQSILMEHLNI